MVVTVLARKVIDQPAPPLAEGEIEGLVRMIAKGVHPLALAKRLYPSDRLARRRAYHRMIQATLNDDRVHQRLAASHRVDFMVATGPAIRALGRRAAKGNVPAQKLLLEATGVHNPRVRHEHSGEIKIKFEAPRPTFEQHITDADVVEE